MEKSARVNKKDSCVGVNGVFDANGPVGLCVSLGVRMRVRARNVGMSVRVWAWVTVSVPVCVCVHCDWQARVGLGP
jgi:hypothetical protein